MFAVVSHLLKPQGPKQKLRSYGKLQPSSSPDSELGLLSSVAGPGCARSWQQGSTQPSHCLSSLAFIDKSTPFRSYSHTPRACTAVHSTSDTKKQPQSVNMADFAEMEDKPQRNRGISESTSWRTSTFMLASTSTLHSLANEFWQCCQSSQRSATGMYLPSSATLNEY
jgi:hypothetical protein